MTELSFLAKVGDKEITSADLESAINGLDQRQRAQFDNEEGRKRILADLINQELFYLDALDSKMDEDENFVKEMELIKENMLKQYAINACLSSVKVDEDEKIKFYEENKDQFINPETVTAKHILVDNEELANDIEKMLNKKEISFEDAAVKYSSCPSNMSGGDLGTFGRGQMVPEFEDAAFDLAVGKISSPVKTQFGYHIITVEDHSESKQAEYEEVKSEVENSLIYKKQNEAFVSKLTDLTEKYKDILVINNK
ncbi:peptidylprolyl isomerase [Peptostreptococcus faecalis]|uniref:peptidylprolyl isomerase n=1 Tax=Peptostreptococcus faecalis TaxID=2045015 RepID=UPI000C7D0D63|nr:peptidylprolyl isomerase [Peptostreptococcus faecalis]